MALDTVILEAARAIRPCLPDLVGAEAIEVDRRLAELLGRPDDTQVAALILAELGIRPATRDWFTAFTRRLVPPSADEILGDREKTGNPPLGGGPPPGAGEAVGGVRFACQEADYVWYRHTVGEEIPRCPTHDLPLVRQQAP